MPYLDSPREKRGQPTPEFLREGGRPGERECNVRVRGVKTGEGVSLSRCLCVLQEERAGWLSGSSPVEICQSSRAPTANPRRTPQTSSLWADKLRQMVINKWTPPRFLPTRTGAHSRLEHVVALLRSWRGHRQIEVHYHLGWSSRGNSKIDNGTQQFYRRVVANVSACFDSPEYLCRQEIKGAGKTNRRSA